MSAKRLICRERPPTVPDRNATGRPIKRVCSECHAERLRRDLERIAELRKAPFHPLANPYGANPDEFGGSDFD